jgi:hypothetical protein
MSRKIFNNGRKKVLPDARDVFYDSTASGLSAIDVESAIDEINSRTTTLEGGGAGSGALQMFRGTLLDAQTGGTIYTVPTGKKLIIVHVVIHSASADLAGGTSFAISNGVYAWVSGISLTSISDNTKFYQHARANGVVTTYAAGDIISLVVTTGSTGAATVTVDLVGYLV